jgi:hypothetical protein
MKGIVDSFQECGSARHEGVPKATEISAIAHFLGEDIGRITFAADMFDGNGPVCNPLTGGVLSVLDMVITVGCQIVAPFHTCFDVVVKQCRLLGIRDWVAKGGEMENHIAYVDRETGTHVGSANFGVTQAERSMLLTSLVQVMGPPERKMMAPLMLQNLKSGSWIPSRIALPI